MTEQEGRILVTGATGNIGGQVVSHLAGTSSGVRAFACDPDSAGRPAGVEVVRGGSGTAPRCRPTPPTGSTPISRA
jgi:uncharacterized protein YbjT (DUF2867 family)